MDKNLNSKILSTQEIFQGTSESFLPIESFLKVPLNQRAYEWDNTNLNDFINDLISNYNKTNNQYFMGNLIFDYSKIENGYLIEIQDGQQRITTITLFFAALRKFLSIYQHFHNNGDPNNLKNANLEEKINDIYIMAEKIIIADSNNNLKNVKFNFSSGISYDFFNELLSYSYNDKFEFYQEDDLLLDIRNTMDIDSHGKIKTVSYRNLRFVDKNILNAYKFFYEFFYYKWKDYSNSDSPAVSSKNIFKKEKLDLHKLAEFLYKNVLFNVLKLENEFSYKKFTIFESINARGKQLKESDKLKNHILSNIYMYQEDKIEDSITLWGQIIHNTDTHIEDFVKDMVTLEVNDLLSKQNFKSIKDPSSNNVYNEFKNFYIDKTNYLDYFILIKRWQKYSEFYKKIISLSENDSSIIDGAQFHNTKEVLKTEFKISRILQMQMWRLFNKDESVKNLFHALVIIYILSVSLKVNDTYSKVSKLKKTLLKEMKENNLFSLDNPRQYEYKHIKNVLINIYKQLKDSNSVKNYQNHLKADVLRQKIRSELTLDNKIAKYLLITYENHSQDITKLMSKNSETDYHLEHILPINPREDDYEGYVKRTSKEFNRTVQSLGNGLIIQETLNNECRNKSIKEKIHIYDKAPNKTRMLNEFLEYVNNNVFNSKNIVNDIKNRTSDIAEKMYQEGIFDVEKMLMD